MKTPDDICMLCEHYKPNNTDENISMGCRAFPKGIPYLFPPNNEHDTKLDGQVGDFVFKKAANPNIRYLSLPE